MVFPVAVADLPSQSLFKQGDIYSFVLIHKPHCELLLVENYILQSYSYILHGNEYCSLGSHKGATVARIIFFSTDHGELLQRTGFFSVQLIFASSSNYHYCTRINHALSMGIFFYNHQCTGDAICRNLFPDRGKQLEINTGP